MKSGLSLKSERELGLMARAGQLVAQVHQELKQMVRPGVRLLELDEYAFQRTLELGAEPAFKGYMGYQHTLCLSVNEQIVHGIPSSRKLKEGDILSIDFGLKWEGYYGDSAVTLPVGEITLEAARLMLVTMESLFAGIEQMVPGNRLSDVSRAIESKVLPHGYGIVREFVGHGIGRALHEAPQVPNYEEGASRLVLREGMVLALEPMINEGTARVRILEDGWTAVTQDGSLSAHYEHTVAITANGPRILTRWDQEPFGGLDRELKKRIGKE